MNDFTEPIARIQESIQRVPDRLSSPSGEAARSEFARIFGECIFGHIDKEGGLYLSLPFQVSILTDPVLYIVGGGLLLLDHPIKRGQYEFAFGKGVHVIDLNRKWSLYENRYPRMIACARKGERLLPGLMLNRLEALEFRGPFFK